ncbi:unnamed protein product [Closterium sp. Naga37s-1]|nr:unnamed protein product [Closterium sp. Naga37s-1]
MDGGDDPNRRYTVDDALSAVGFGAFHWLLLGYAGLAWAAEAMELLLLSFIAAPAAAHWGVGGDGEAALSSVVFTGMLVGAFAWGLLADSRGRRFAFTATALLTFLAVLLCFPKLSACPTSPQTRFAFTATALLTFLAALLSALAPSFPLLLAARALVGVGLGGAPVIFSLFLEFTPPASRGFWSLALSLFWTVGSVAEAALAWAVLPVLGWRWLIVLSSLPLLLPLLLFPLLPESPRFLLVKSRPSDALAVLQHVARLNRRALPAGQVSLVAGGGGSQVLALAALPAATVAALFVARAAIMGSFQTLFMFAPELYATSVRSSGLGFASSFSRLGGIVCPYVAITLVQGCQLSTALSLFVAVPLTAAIATTFFPVETARRALIEVHVEEGGYGGQSDQEKGRKQGVVKDDSRGL